MENILLHRAADLLSPRFLISVLVIVLVVFAIQASPAEQIGFISMVVGAYIALPKVGKQPQDAPNALEVASKQP